LRQRNNYFAAAQHCLFFRQRQGKGVFLRLEMGLRPEKSLEKTVVYGYFGIFYPPALY